MSDYSQKLLDPRWQKVRLKILERDDWRCKCCNDDKSTLHVHHSKYAGEPWEIEEMHLKTVCGDCHLLIHFLEEHGITEWISIKKTTFYNVVTHIIFLEKTLIVKRINEPSGIQMEYETFKIIKPELERIGVL